MLFPLHRPFEHYLLSSVHFEQLAEKQQTTDNVPFGLKHEVNQLLYMHDSLTLVTVQVLREPL